jgi:hypothetical protein
MPTRRPDQRYLSIKSNTKRAPRHQLEKALWKMLHRKGADPTVGYAFEIYSNEFQREAMQAWLLARADYTQIQQHLRVPPDVSDAYRYLFFDVGLFRDELDLLSWVHEYEQNQQGTPQGAQLLKLAVTGGVDALAWLFGRGEFAVDPDKVTNQVMTDSFFRGQSNRGHGVSSKEAAAAHRFYQTAFRVAQPLANKGDANALNGIRIKLLHRDLTAPVDSVPPEDLLQ